MQSLTAIIFMWEKPNRNVDHFLFEKDNDY